MSLKAKLTKDEHAKLETTLQALYTEKGGAFLLQVEGVVPQEDFDASESKLAEFRDNNRKLFADLKKFEGVDPDEYKTLKETAGKLGKQGVTKPDDIQALIQAEVAKVADPLTASVKKMQEERDIALRRVADKTLEDKLWEAGLAAGVKESAKPDFLARAKSLFTIEGDDKIVAKRGDAPVYSKRRNNTTNSLTPEEWATDPDWLLKDADHLYKKSTGTNAQQNKAENGARLVQNDPMALGLQLEDMAKGNVQVLTGA